MDGTIKRLVSDKGFGFLRENTTGTEYFFHRSALHGERRLEHLREGEAVTFEPEPNSNSPKGPRVLRMEPTTH